MQASSATTTRTELRAIDSEKECFQRLYHSYASLAYGIILRFIDSSTDAAHVLEQVFLEVCREGIPKPQAISKQHIVRTALRLSCAHLKHTIPEAAIQQKAADLLARKRA